MEPIYLKREEWGQMEAKSSSNVAVSNENNKNQIICNNCTSYIINKWLFFFCFIITK